MNAVTKTTKKESKMLERIIAFLMFVALTLLVLNLVFTAIVAPF